LELLGAVGFVCAAVVAVAEFEGADLAFAFPDYVFVGEEAGAHTGYGDGEVSEARARSQRVADVSVWGEMTRVRVEKAVV